MNHRNTPYRRRLGDQHPPALRAIGVLPRRCRLHGGELDGGEVEKAAAATAPVHLGDRHATVTRAPSLVLGEYAWIEAWRGVAAFDGELRSLLVDRRFGGRQLAGSGLGCGGDVDLGAVRGGEVTVRSCPCKRSR